MTTSADHVTISDAAKLWIARCELERLERATLHSYRSQLRNHIEPKIGHLLLKTFSAVNVREFLDSMLRDSTRAMAKKCLTTLRSIISAAQERGLVQHNVARDVKLRRSERHEPNRVFPTKDEIKALIANASERHQPLIMTALLTGMRMSELRGLAWSAVNFERSVISVTQRADCYCKMGNTKSKSGRREIPVGAELAKVLKAWKVTCPKGKLDLVFPNGVGKVETHSNIYNRIFKPLMLKCGIIDGEGAPRFSLHAMRHAAASLFIEQGWPPKKIQTILGHSSITMTYDVYGHLFHDPAKDVDLMSEMERELLAA
ncbi:tyrosine-type recombinase/integrase [Altererythrobacter ishigakiensis]|uniref:Site-specific recombinase XerD n=1 Tax=Altererythrobacter ishigakiensis TaxID=476157 RepID=A0A562UVY8_9SPHN|nr:site-specific integrase [Altererythrobacter ishigakiensis]TWJ09800.1 site-specific recombinase XerD [Altererythrobacter ishigakiensis]